MDRPRPAPRLLRPLLLSFAFILSSTGARAANNPPNAPTWVEPDPGQIISAYDPHINVNAFSDPNPGDQHLSSDFEIWDDLLNVRVWADLDETVSKYHVHWGNGVPEGPLAGETRLDFDRAYRFRARFRDNSGTGNSYSNWSVWVTAQTAPATQILPMLLRDTLPIAYVWKTEAGVNIDLPSNASLRLYGTTTSNNLFRVNGQSGTDTWTDYASLSDHRALKIHLFAPSMGLSRPAGQVTITDADSLKRDIYLPAVNLGMNQTAAFWIDDAGRSYTTTTGSTTPDFSSLAQDVFMTWKTNFPNFQVERVVSNLQLPVNIAFVPNPGPAGLDPFFYVTELYGKVKVVTRNLSVFTFADSLLNFDPNEEFPGDGELGITGVCVEPASGDVFVCGIYDAGGPFLNRVMRLYSSNNGLSMDSMRVIVSGIFSATSHQVQQCTIGPDGKLYVQVGDGHSPDTTTAQNPNDLRGKVLRMNLDGSAPGDNPYGASSKVWAVGFRNPFGGGWSGNKLYVSDNSDNGDDRVAQVNAGGDYGWCCDNTQGTLRFVPGTGITGLAVAPSWFGGPAYAGNVFVGISGPTYAPGTTTNGKEIRMIDLNASGVAVSDSAFIDYVGAGYGTVVGVAFGPDGLYFSDLYGDAGIDGSGLTNANIYRIPFSTTGIDPTESARITLDGRVFPNPTSGGSTLRFSLDLGQGVAVRVFDASGRLVRTLRDGWSGSGEQLVGWDGKDAAGRGVASGVYFFRIEPELGESRTARVTLLR